MPDPNPSAVAFLNTRRSRPAKTLTGPAPNTTELKNLLTAAARTPDHGKLEPWRFIVVSGDGLHRLADKAVTRGNALGFDADQVEKVRAQFANSPLMVAVVSAPVDNPKVPRIEQTYSAGAVCLALLNICLASGWGANWLSGWASHDPEFCAAALGLKDGESIAGFIHIGTETNTPPERPRPDIDQITSWINS